MAFTDSGELDPSTPVHIVCLGKKNSGKSVVARVIADSWPGDLLVVDVNGTIAPHDDWVEFRHVPSSWPDEKRDGDEPLVVHYIPDMSAENAIEDIDRMLAIAYEKGEILVWVDEAGVVARSNAVPRYTRQILHQGRHRRVSSIWCSPRAVSMDTLVVAQADLVYIFTMPSPSDKQRVADTIGWDVRDFSDAVAGLKQHEFLLFDALADPPEEGAADMRLVHYPPLPARVVIAPRSATAAPLDSWLDKI